MATESIQDAKSRVTTAVLLGAPNAGKTSLYNHLTGSRYKTVNYPGATVEFSVGKLRADGRPRAAVPGASCHAPQPGVVVEPGDFLVLDTPGIVSLVPRTADERVALAALSRTGALVAGAGETPDVVVVVLDATQPGRHLPLVRQVLRAGFPAVVALTMNDLARSRGRALDPDRLSRSLTVPVAEVDGRTGAGLAELVSCIEAVAGASEPGPRNLPESASEDSIRADFRWADALVAEQLGGEQVREKGSRVDRLVLHPVLGLVVFVLVMTGLFWSVFSAAQPLMDLVGAGFKFLGDQAGALLPEGWIRGLVVDGVIAGGGSVFTFVPQIAILFLLLGILEDSGYLARGAMLVDRFLEAIGLNGKSFVPLLSGNACAIPAAMAARTIPGRRERLLTLLVVPLMSCSARLPVWGLLLGFLVPADRTWLGGLALAGIYVASLAMASAVAVVGGRILRIEPSKTGFQVELPLWRPPTFRTVVVSTWDRTVSYLKRAGLTILGVSVGFWLLMNLPSPEHSAAMVVGHWITPFLTPMGLDWRVGVALVAAFAAREVFVSALAVVFSVQAAEGDDKGILDAMRAATFDGTHLPVFTTSSILGLVVFFLISLQCMTTVAVMRRETSDRFAFGQMAAFLVLAWVLAVVVVQGLRAVGVA
jgi:ferrous iron transport protein B